jgi:hypothetical protein
MPLSDTSKNGENGMIYTFSLLLEGGPEKMNFTENLSYVLSLIIKIMLNNLILIYLHEIAEIRIITLNQKRNHDGHLSYAYQNNGCHIR